ncbi:electron transfer flavoprotein subunit alpha/FixB family protein [Halorubrum distributum]|uniref:Electron transfer flavoprotein subunit alpha n=2 Tax=Halorubrum distributum TaxID=29283 RepID=M0DI39_9EURY|nr:MULTISPECIES: electron transfer flavoprotein subunit alpha/FixB family protein [Halorubrum distributum group]ELZ34387.1 electron transfer flavoprotein subunit alpha [Halorubrum terrestre JCM 10247]MDV7350182.1 electron transfer flavoprotein subunit alpha/FixB family protein [Halorubrum distributum]MYL16622.1 electron transfer flavoprotein subunit alpha/FixB family protein [Halorubrum terrestre]MYL66117.1 electron transfer flavoprotein subunit alpha/FixB family protein [Halorubrum terrestre]
MADVLVAAEHRRGALRDVTYEAITAGRELADARGGDLHVAVVGGDVDGFAEDVNREGVDAIHAVDDGEEFDHNAYQAAVSTLADRIDAGAVVLPNSVNGLDYAPALAEDLGVPVVTDAVGIEYDDGLTVTREMYGSKVETTVDVAGDRFVLTVRGGEWPPAEGVGDATVEAADVDIPESGARVTGFEEVGGGDVDIADADVLVSVGRGIEEEENLELVEELADALGATLSASRPIVDNGWLPKNRQVGQSGKVVTPDVYIAVGISGAVQHVAGMKGSDTIIAINTDPNAPIFDIADYGIVGDLFDVVPELIDEFA